MIKRILPHVIVALMFCTTMYLAIWQLQRMQWKNNLLASIEQNMQISILVDDFTNLENDMFKLMQVQGSFLHDEEIHLLSRTYNGKPGFHVLTPLLQANGDKILVNRGWVKSDEDYEKPEQPVEVEGVIRAASKPGWLSLKNDPQKNHWFHIDLPLIYKNINTTEKPYYIDRVSDEKNYPLALPKKIKLHNEHLQYVITWFSLSFALIIMYYYRFWKNRKK